MPASFFVGVPAALGTAALEPLEGGALHWLAFVLVVCGGLVAYTGGAGARRTLRPNALVGIRTRLTMGDEGAWYEVHQKAAPWLVASGVAMALPAAALYLVGHGPTQLALLAVGLVASMALLIAGAVGASRTVREERDRAAGSPGAGTSTPE